MEAIFSLVSPGSFQVIVEIIRFKFDFDECLFVCARTYTETDEKSMYDQRSILAKQSPTGGKRSSEVGVSYSSGPS